MNNKPPFGLLFDINGDRCPKLLSGAIAFVVFIVFCTVGFFYALNHEIKCQSLVEFILGSLGGGWLGAFGISTLQKIRGINNDEKTD
jgi:uncharacterized membrane protein YfcA